jgi:glutaminase
MDYQALLEQLYQKYRGHCEGEVANYIPELAKARADWFGISLVTAQGEVFEVGDCSQTFTMQSVSKPLAYGLALQDRGRSEVLQRVGVEPTGDAFNCIIKLDEASKRPYNPMVNAGAIATSALIVGESPTERWNRLIDTLSLYLNRRAVADMAVFLSERSTGHRNRAIAHLMLNFGMLERDVEEVLDFYFQQCSILVSSTDLALIAATLANQGLQPQTGRRAVAAEYCRDILSVMLTCGLYDYSGEWVYRVGIPAKSGVSGGLMAVAPGRLGIGIFSPPLDSRGNSLRAIAVCSELSQLLGLHLFHGGSRPEDTLELTSPGKFHAQAD